jgi:REP element-mobilizing transposase RayT
MEDKFQNKYRVSSPRLSGWDYGAHGLYFVTICTKDRVPHFGEVLQSDPQSNPIVQQTDIGKATHKHWEQIPEFHPYVHLDEFIVMPDHLHGILFFNRPNKDTWEVNKFGGQRKNLASVIRGFKGSVKKYAILNNIEFEWQPRYYDRVIRDEKEYDNIRAYIYNNPDNWFVKNEGFENLYF